MFRWRSSESVGHGAGRHSDPQDEHFRILSCRRGMPLSRVALCIRVLEWGTALWTSQGTTARTQVRRRLHVRAQLINRKSLPRGPQRNWFWVWSDHQSLGPFSHIPFFFRGKSTQTRRVSCGAWGFHMAHHGGGKGGSARDQSRNLVPTLACFDASLQLQIQEPGVITPPLSLRFGVCVCARDAAFVSPQFPGCSLSLITR